MSENYFQRLNDINVNAHIEKKNGLSYLSWPYAWAEVKKAFPDSTYTVYENRDGWNYFTDGRTCWVKTGVTVNGIEHIEYLPVMDMRNKSISAENITSFDVNKAIQRSLTKAAARHGLGLYVYAGEDLPECESTDNAPTPNVEMTKTVLLGLGKAMGRDEEKVKTFAEALTGVAWDAMTADQCAKVKLELARRASAEAKEREGK